MYTTELKIYAPDGDEFSKEDPIVCTVEAETVPAAKAVDQKIWEVVADHEELKNTPVEVSAIITDSEDDENQFEEDWDFVFYADVCENEDGSMDETGSTLTIRPYEENEPVSYFEPTKREAYEEPGIIEPVPSDDGDDGDTDVAPGPADVDDSSSEDESSEDESDDGDDSDKESAPVEDDAISTTSAKSKKSK